MQSVFVSNTFKDMQGERDALHRIVMPRLQAQARSDFESRWPWACMPVLEGYYHAGQDKTLCLAACQKAVEVLEKLEPEAEKYIDSVVVTKQAVQNQKAYVQKLMSKA